MFALLLYETYGLVSLHYKYAHRFCFRSLMVSFMCSLIFFISGYQLFFLFFRHTDVYTIYQCSLVFSNFFSWDLDR